MKAGDLDGAIADFSKVISLDPNNVRTYGIRGLARSRKGDLDGAIDDYSKVISLEPNKKAAYILRGNAQFEKGNLSGAIDDYNNVIRLDPSNAEMYLSRAFARSRKGDLGGAIADCRKAIRLAPNDATAYNGLAWLLATSNNPTHHDGREALGLARQAISLDNNNHAYMDTLAAAYARGGVFDKAVSTQKKTLRMAKKEHQREGVIQELKARLGLYRQGKPYQEKKR